MDTDIETIHIFIDASHYIFHRLTALQSYWGRSGKGQPKQPHKNPEFVSQFKDLFVRHLQDIPKKLKLLTRQTKKAYNEGKLVFKYYIGKDCPADKIWRNELYNEYKGTRDRGNNIPALFFRIVYKEKLFHQAYGDDILVLEYDTLEADDCIALYAEHVRCYTNDKIYIITGDHDYMQLFDKNGQIHIFNPKWEDLRSKMAFEDSYDQLLLKIIQGDNSDNIPAIQPGMGQASAKKLIKDKNKLRKLFKDNPKAKETFLHNETLISFSCIPQNLMFLFYQKYGII